MTDAAPIGDLDGSEAPAVDGGGGRRRSRADRAARRTARLDHSHFVATSLENALGTVNLLTEEQVEAIHEASLKLLEEIGIEFMGASARETFRAAGAIVDDETGLVRIPRDVVEAAVSSAPREFTVTPRGADRKIHAGGDVRRLRSRRRPADGAGPGARPSAREPRGLHHLAQARPELRRDPLHRQPADAPGRARADDAASRHATSRTSRTPTAHFTASRSDATASSTRSRSRRSPAG